MELTLNTPCYFPRYTYCYTFGNGKKLKAVELLAYSLIASVKEWQLDNEETVIAPVDVIKYSLRLSAPTVRSTISKLISYGLLDRMAKDEYKVIHWEEAATAGELGQEELNEIALRESVGGNSE